MILLFVEFVLWVGMLGFEPKTLEVTLIIVTCGTFFKLYDYINNNINNNIVFTLCARSKPLVH